VEVIPGRPRTQASATAAALAPISAAISLTVSLRHRDKLALRGPFEQGVLKLQGDDRRPAAEARDGRRLGRRPGWRVREPDVGDVAGAGHAVGYTSASQFNREYRRMFGAPPGLDAARLQHSHLAAE
jgi:AraC-like DNA-binding protein